MADIEDDFLGSLEDEAGKEPPGPALIIPASGPPDELETHDKAYLNAMAGANKCIFTATDDVTGEEIFENAEQWQRWMQWPRLPTLEEAEAYQRHALASLQALTWWDLQAFRASKGLPPKPASVAVVDDPEPIPIKRGPTA
jgi:hypothetical protein